MAGDERCLDVGNPWGVLWGVDRFTWERIILRCRFPRQSTKLVAFVLATYADADTGMRIRPGLARVAREVGLSEQMVGRHVRALEAYGLLHCEVRGSSYGRGGKGKASLYRLMGPMEILDWYAAGERAGWPIDPYPQWDLAEHPDAEEIFSPKKHRDSTTPDQAETP